MLLEDETEFLEFIEARDIAVYPYRNNKLPFPEIKQLPKPFSIDFWGHNFLVNKKLKKIKYHYIKEQKNYYIDLIESEVIEFSRCGLKKDGHLLEGRIYVNTSYTIQDSFGQAQWVNKSGDFIKWYEEIARWLRKNYWKYGSIYISKRVLNWVTNGGRLCTINSKKMLENWRKRSKGVKKTKLVK